MRKLSLGLDRLALSRGACALTLAALAACGGQAPAAQPQAAAPPPADSAQAAALPPLKNPQHEAFERNFAEALNESGPRVRACFEDGKKKNPKLGGLFSATVEIGGDGRIAGAELDASSTLTDPAVVKCMLGVVKGIGTIENPTAATSSVTYAMNFAAEGDQPVGTSTKPGPTSGGPAPGASTAAK